MYFEAESSIYKYKVQLTENRDSWTISIKKNDGEWVNYDIKKQDFKKLDNTISFTFKGQSYLVDTVGQNTEYTVYTRGSFRKIKIFNDEMLLHESLKSGKSLSGGSALTSGMPGKIVKIFVKPGQDVKENSPLLIMEAMKMENELRADRDVKIKAIHVNEGESVESGATLVTYE